MAHTPNFLDVPGAPAARARFPRSAIVGVTIVVLLVVVGVGLRGTVQSVVRAWQYANAGKEAVVRAEELGAALNFEAADQALASATADFTRATIELESVRWLRRVPFVGTQVRATDDLLAAGIETIAAVREVLAFGVELSAVIGDLELVRKTLAPGLPPTASLGSLTREEKRTILARFVQLVPHLEAAKERMDQAMVRFDEIPRSGLIRPLALTISRLRDQLPRLRDDLTRIVPIAHILPAFAGYPEAKQTLVLFLNNTELRPGGGFIGTVGRLEVADATILSLETRDAYAVDRPAESFLNVPPPAPLTQYLGVTRWFMRDANWSPDFLVSSEQVIDFYERETSAGARTGVIDNLIGFTPTFASEILRITGPITIEDQTFTAENLYDTLEYQVEQGFTERGVPFEQRKEILARLVDATVVKLLALPASRWEEVLAVLDRGFREKQIMLYDRDPALAAQLAVQRWDGGVDFSTGDALAGDFFMVVDANLGSLKSDPAVKRRIHYSLTPVDDSFEATVSVTYRHEGRFDWKTTRYRTYTRLYVPRGSEFVSASGHLRDDKIKNPNRESGTVDVGRATDLHDLQGRVRADLEVFGTFVAIEPGEERTLSFTYRLPESLVNQIRTGIYTLKAQKQLGALPYELTLDLDFGKTLIRATPAEPSEQFFDSRYRVRSDLAEDRFFQVQF